MAKLILYGGLPFLKTIVALYGKKMQKIELTNEDYQQPVAEVAVEEQPQGEIEVTTEAEAEVKPKKKKK